MKKLTHPSFYNFFLTLVILLSLFVEVLGQTPSPSISPSNITSNENQPTPSVNGSSFAATSIDNTPEPTNVIAETTLPTLQNVTIDSPSSNLFTGAVTFSVPIDLPQGRNGMNPNISLSYNSMAGNGWLGFGWVLELGSIERNIKNGINFDSDDFILKTNKGAKELIRITPNEYRTKIEDDFFKIEEKNDSLDGKQYFIVTDKSGIRYFFGKTLNARHFDQNNDSHIFKWLLERTEDTHGNYMEIGYFRDNENNQIYIDWLSYTGNEGLSPTNTIRFYREERPDALDQYSTGFRVKTNFRLKTIIVSANDTIYSAYKIEYKKSANTNRSLLTTVTQYGKNSEVDAYSGEIISGESLPQSKFTYFDSKVKFKDGFLKDHFGSGEAFRYRYADVDGDGKTDISHTGADNRLQVGLTGSGEVKNLQLDNGDPNRNFFSDFDGDGNADLIHFGSDGKQHIWKGPNFSTGWISNIGDNDPSRYQFADFNGDGRMDLLHINGNDGPNGGHLTIRLSTGSSFGSGWEQNPFNDKFLDKYKCADINGDGNTDLIHIKYGESAGEIEVLFSNGSVFKSLGAALVANWDTNLDQTRDPRRYRFADFNGDRLADFVYTGGEPNQTVFLSTGIQFTRGWSKHILSGDLTRYFYSDFNGDGKSDVGHLSDNGLLEIHLSSGASFENGTYQMNFGNGEPARFRFADFTGEGKSDVVHIGAEGNQYVFVTSPDASDEVLVNSDGVTDLCETVTNILGGTSLLSYKVKNVPNPVPTIASIEELDGRGSTLKTDYVYEGGLNYIQEREFRGFNHVKILNPKGNQNQQEITDIWFHQGNDTLLTNNPKGCLGYMKGKPYVIQTSDGQGKVYTKTTIKYKSSPQNPCQSPITSSFFNPPSEIIEYSCESGDCETGKRVITRYYYEDLFGNLTRIENFGDSSTPADDYTIKRNYTDNRNNWLVGLMVNETYFSGIGTTSTIKKAATINCFDSINCTTSNSNLMPTIGDLRSVIKWHEGGENPVHQYTYDKYGNLIQIVDPKKNLKTISYDYSFTFPTVITDAKNLITKIKYHGVDDMSVETGRFGQVKEFIEPNGFSSFLEYDSFGRQKSVTLADGSKQTWNYVDYGNPNNQHIETSESNKIIQMSYFDGLGRTWAEKITGQDNEFITRLIKFDERGLISSESLPFLNEIESPKWTEFFYDAIGRQIKIIGADQSEIKKCYQDWISVSINEEGSRLRETKDAFGRPILIEEYEGTFSDCSVDEKPLIGEIDRINLVKMFPNSIPPEKITPYSRTSYDYDIFGNLVLLTDNKNNNFQVVFDSLGRVRESVDPDLGKWSYEYDLNDNLIKRSDANGQKVFFQYDEIDRLIQKDYGERQPIGQGEEILSYDDETKIGKGRLTSVTDYTGITTYNYNQLGEITEENKSIFGNNFTLKFSYDEIGRIASITYPDGDIIGYEYSGQFLRRTFNKTQNLDFIRFNSYSPLGNPIEVNFGNGISTQYTYSNLENVECSQNNYRLCTITSWKSPNSPIHSEKFYYDRAGKIIGISEINNVTTKFIYDAQERLIATGKLNNELEYSKVISIPPLKSFTQKEKEQGIKALSVETSFDEFFSYDEIGNLTYSSRNGEYKYGDENVVGRFPHAVTSIKKNGVTKKYKYDLNGNLIEGGNRIYNYNFENHPTFIRNGAERTINEYDWNGERVQKTVGNLSTLYFEDYYECTTNKECNKFIYANGERIAEKGVNSGKILYYHADYNGSIRLISDETGNVFQKLKYSPYGTVIENTLPNSSEISNQFTGAEFDYSTRLTKLGDRFYDPELQRFISPDNILPFPYFPQSINRYSYALNSPLNYIDPSGHTPSKDPDMAGAMPGDKDGPYKEKEVKTQEREVREPVVREPTDKNTDKERNVREVRDGPSWVKDRDTRDSKTRINQESRSDFSLYDKPIEPIPIDIIVGGVAYLGRRVIFASIGFIASSFTTRARFNPNRAHHIFRNAKGHVNPKSLSSKARYIRIFERVASSSSSKSLPYKGAGSGVSTISQKFRSGKEVWVNVRKGEITNAGVNPAKKP